MSFFCACTSTTEGTGLFNPPAAAAQQAPSPAPPSPCANILGNWKIKATRTDGDCDKSKFKSTQYDVTLRRDTAAASTTTPSDASDGDSDAAAPPTTRIMIVLPGFGGCPGDFEQSTCKLVANCDVTAEGKTVGSAGLDWTFNEGTLTGTEISRALPPLSDRSCNANYSDEGEKL